jgi:uncharacterized protein YbjT (DUF2867 family)
MAGSWVVDGLMKAGETVRCMSRSWNKIAHLPEGIERIAADLEKPHTLADAFHGADKVFLLVPLSGNEIAQGLHAVEAAAAQGVKKIVYLSAYMPPGSHAIPHFNSKIRVENAVRESGIDYTILRPNDFFQNDVSVIGVMTGYGIYPIPIGSIGLNRIDVRDVADAAVRALTRPGFEGRTYSLHGPDTLTGGDVAGVYSRFVGRGVRYAGDNLDVWARHVRSIMPEWLSRDLRIMFGYFQSRGMIAPGGDLEQQLELLDHEPRSFDRFAEELAREWRRTLAWAA